MNAIRLVLNPPSIAKAPPEAETCAWCGMGQVAQRLSLCLRDSAEKLDKLVCRLAYNRPDWSVARQEVPLETIGVQPSEQSVEPPVQPQIQETGPETEALLHLQGEVTEVISNEIRNDLTTTNPQRKEWIIEALEVHRSRSTHKVVPHSLQPVFAEAEMGLLFKILINEKLTLKLGQTADEFMKFKTNKIYLGGGYQFTTTGDQLKKLLKVDRLSVLIEKKRPDLFHTPEATEGVTKAVTKILDNLDRLLSSKFLQVAIGEHGAANMNYCIKTALGMMASPATPFPTE